VRELIIGDGMTRPYGEDALNVREANSITL